MYVKPTKEILANKAHSINKVHQAAFFLCVCMGKVKV